MTILAVYISKEAEQHYVKVAEDLFIPFAESSASEVQSSVDFIKKNGFGMFGWFATEDVEAEAGPITSMTDVKDQFITEGD